LLSLQLTGVPGRQTPPWQTSEPLQMLPSPHDVPFERAVCWQPVVMLQLSSVHGLPSPQLSGAPAVQAPPWQVSAPLHTLPSLHDVLLATA